ncbi:MAG: TIGR03016 family PEP-CTERM system-associated outer membrane protein, partial [Lamprocystis purpurea]|nr:TIGR03016 family PEP-CTERM system-associated outer membrane protein [Lamprocystis purpurea]
MFTLLLNLYQRCSARRFLGASASPGVLLVLAILSARSIEAEPIVASAGVLSRLVFTDNLFLTAQRPEPAMIFQLTPNITGGRRGSRSSYRWYYGPSALFYSGGHSDLNHVFHVLQANASVDLIKEYFALQLTANANQNLVDPTVQSTGFDAFGNPDAFAQTASVSVAPVIQFPLLRANVATVRFAPGFNYVFAAKTAEGARNAGSTGSQSYLTIASGDYFSRAPWDVAAFSNIFSRDNDKDSDNDTDGISNIRGTVTYPVSAKWNIQGLVGYEWGQYESLSEPGGWRWRVTPYWSPSQNTSIGLGYGWRYFGADYFASIKYRHKKTVVTMSYEVAVSNARTALLDTPVVYFEDAFGEPIISPTSEQTLAGSV